MTNSSISKNIVANAFGKIWTVVVSMLFVPVYIKLLGEEAYGIVTFFTVLQSVLNIMGVGLQRTLRREFAESSKDIDKINQKKYRLLRTIEFIYFFVGVVIILICRIGSTRIANKWLRYDSLDPIVVANTITLMGVSIALQLIANLYAGGIYGLDLQPLANLMQIIWMTVKNAGVICVLLLISNDLITFYIWMVIVDCGYCIALRLVLLNRIPVRDGHNWTFHHFSNIKGIWRYAAGLLIISVGSAINTQLDKIIMSKYLPIIQCGAYNSAVHLGSFTAYVPAIIGTAIFSNIATLVFKRRITEARAIFTQMSRLSVIVVSAFSAYVSLFSYELMLVWTQSLEYANIMRYAAPLVIVGYTLNAFQQVPYDYLLASGNTKINQIQLICCMPYIATVTVFLTRKWGVNGAAFAWALELLISTTLYLYFFYRISFKENALRWVFLEVYGIYIIALIPAFAIRVITNKLYLNSYITLLLAIVSGAATLIIMLYIFERALVKRYILSILKKKAIK